jgi:histidinol dehydrogenase
MHISLAHLYAVSAASLANITPQTDEVTKLVKAETDRAARETAKAKDGVRLQAETIIPELQDRKPDELKEQARKLFAQALAEIDAVTDDLTADTETMTEVIGLLSRQSAACDKFATDLENEHTE